MSVLEFKRKSKEAADEAVPTATGPAKCLACLHEWVFVIPSVQPALDLQCPACRLHRGKRMGLTIPGEDRWVCNCGNDLFLVTKDRVFCPQCATFQLFDPRGAV